MRRLFILRKDLNMSTGKLLAQISHCAEGYWTRMIMDNGKTVGDKFVSETSVDKNVYDNYLNDIYKKTICEAKSKNKLLKAKIIAEELGLVENVDFGLIYDRCLTELIPEEDDGTCLTGIWFKPLDDDIAHKISKKYQLYK